MSDEKSKDSKSRGKENLLILTLFCMLVMIIAVGLIYYYVKVDPAIVNENAQTTQVSENSENTGYVNPDSIQKLENDASNITMQPVKNSTPFIICGAVFMVVMAGAFIYVKVAESKEE